MRPVTKVAVLALVGVLSLSACSSVSQEAIEAEKFAQSTLDDPKIPVGPGSTLNVEAFEWGFNVDGVAVDGAVTINFENLSTAAVHNFRIDNAAGENKLVESGPGESATGDLLLFGGGEYTYYCDISGHRTQGMVGTLRVFLPDEAPTDGGTQASEAPSESASASESASPTVEELDDSDDVAGALDANGVARLYQVTFASGSSELSDDAQPVIDQMVAYLEANGAASFRIEGNTDSSGSEDANLELSQERAEAVVAALVDAGVEPSRLEAVGNGETNPIIADEQGEADQAVNRRVEVHLA